MTINGFWHILMINNYLDIISEQLRLIVESGLYYNVDSIYIGCLGPEKEKLEIENIFHDYPKIKIVSHDIIKEKYEFHTLKILKSIALNQPSFYGFYIHTKGISFPNNEGGIYWRDYMNYYILTNWQEAINHLKIGYDVYGVKLLSPRDTLKNPAKKLHYSGNFFWFKSEYAKTLIPVESLNQKDRFEAEMYICSNHPIAATGCQDFVDYNTKGTFKPPSV